MRFLRTVGRNGTMTLPVELREVLGVDDGDIVEFEVLAVVRRKADRKIDSRAPATAIPLVSKESKA